MKSHRMLSLLALLGGLGLSFLLVEGQERPALAATCFNGSPICTRNSDCTAFCGTSVGSICNGLNTPHCCICAE